MRTQPTFYEAVRQNAARRWGQLETDPELAGPWHQLFKQVQSPRHVLSELLQNADDAGATEASVRIENRAFVFEHNGEDFSEEQFASLCRFGYSNKRTLHTIGFRGIGFKSTFSLGDCVRLFTPSLAVSFHRQRFTEPQWLWESEDTLGNGRTRVVVEITDSYRQKEIEKNLEEWLESPVSLLFFKNIRRMHIGDREVHWDSLGPGPIADSEWMALHEHEDEPHLLIQSDAEAFPEDALEEIGQERMLGIEEENEFPPSKIEIVLGAKGRLYVILPTGVQTQLPFACNAPFIQDPSRIEIKDPATSPTNRWLLERIGRLAASVMLHWLAQTDLPTVERAPAYGLFPDVDQKDTSLEGVCGTTVEQTFEREIQGQPVLLTEGGDLTHEKGSVLIPNRLFGVWPAEQAAAILDGGDRPALCRHLEPADRQKLLNWRFVDKIEKQKVFETLETKRAPKPESWRQLLNLWVYLAPEILNYRHYVKERDVCIVPVQGQDSLFAARETVRLGESKLLQSDKDWEFLADHLIVLNQNWPRFLAEQRRSASDEDISEVEAIQAAYDVLEKIGLDDTSEVSKVVDQVAARFFQDGVSIQKCAQLAQVSAKLRVTVGDAFRYATSDGYLRRIKDAVLFDEDGSLSELLPEPLRDSQVLHSEYTTNFSSCTREEWVHWISSGRAGLRTFVRLIVRRSYSGNRRGLDEFLRNRDFAGSLEPHYSDPSFYVEDWDFDPACWAHWEGLAAEDPAIWSVLIERILRGKNPFGPTKHQHVSMR